MIQTKEEILDAIAGYNYQDEGVLFVDVLDAMQTYADQQTAPLREEIERLRLDHARMRGEFMGTLAGLLIYLENPAYIKPGVIQEVEIIIARLDPKNQIK